MNTNKKEKENEKYCEARYKLRVYGTQGLDHEEFFPCREEMEKRYNELFCYEGYSLIATKWKMVNEEWAFIPVPVRMD